jgi:putative tryptophan/tyrosine transport system substrate-binding protein
MSDMRRREFITLLGGAAAAWPIAARAQQSERVRRVGVMMIGSGNDPTWQIYAAALRQGLIDTGYVEGRNLAIEYRWAEGQYDRLAALAAELVHQRVAVIVAGANPSAVAAKAATTTIPIVFRVNRDPVSLGLVAGLNQPGGNLTGVITLSGELGPKRLELMRELIPGAPAVATLINPSNPGSEAHRRTRRRRPVPSVCRCTSCTPAPTANSMQPLQPWSNCGQVGS